MIIPASWQALILKLDSYFDLDYWQSSGKKKLYDLVENELLAQFARFRDIQSINYLRSTSRQAVYTLIWDPRKRDFCTYALTAIRAIIALGVITVVNKVTDIKTPRIVSYVEDFKCMFDYYCLNSGLACIHLCSDELVGNLDLTKEEFLELYEHANYGVLLFSNFKSTDVVDNIITWQAGGFLRGPIELYYSNLNALYKKLKKLVTDYYNGDLLSHIDKE